MVTSLMPFASSYFYNPTASEKSWHNVWTTVLQDLTLYGKPRLTVSSENLLYLPEVMFKEIKLRRKFRELDLAWSDDDENSDHELDIDESPDFQGAVHDANISDDSDFASLELTEDEFTPIVHLSAGSTEESAGGESSSDGWEPSRRLTRQTSEADPEATSERKIALNERRTTLETKRARKEQEQQDRYLSELLQAKEDLKVQKPKDIDVFGKFFLS